LASLQLGHAMSPPVNRHEWTIRYLNYRSSRAGYSLLNGFSLLFFSFISATTLSRDVLAYRALRRVCADSPHRVSHISDSKLDSQKYYILNPPLVTQNKSWEETWKDVAKQYMQCNVLSNDILSKNSDLCNFSFSAIRYKWCTSSVNFHSDKTILKVNTYRAR